MKQLPDMSVGMVCLITIPVRHRDTKRALTSQCEGIIGLLIRLTCTVMAAKEL